MEPFDGFAEILEKRKKPAEEEKKKEQLDPSIDKAIDNLLQPAKKKIRVSEEPKATKTTKTKKTKPKEKKRSDDDRRHIALLTEYGKNEWLGPYLKDNHGFDLEPTKLRKLSGPKLEELLEDVEQVLANKSNSAIGDGVVRGTMYQLEMLASARTPYQIQGTTDRCFENDHWRFLLERVKMKYGVGFGALDPVAELSLVTFQTAAMLHYTNSTSVPDTDLDVEIKSC